jgi:tRNA A-37 threonylcarbamoyl transferase component Bud32
LSSPTPPTPPKTWTKTAERPLRSRWQSLGIWLFAHWLGVRVPWHAVRQTDARGLLAFEHERLLALAAAGEAVPPVIAFDGQSLVTSDIGPTLAHVLSEQPGAQRLATMCAASADLAAFHARGHWHGGAQIRNITWDGVRFARLDFEEPLLPGMPLPTVQLYDALQLLFSLSHHLQPLGAEAVRSVLSAYDNALQAQPAVTGQRPELRAFLLHLLPRLRWVARVAGWSSRLDGSREMQRLRTVLDGMAAFVNDSAAPPSAAA